MHVKLHPAERLLNFIVHHTNLYLRKKKGVPEDALRHQAFRDLVSFFDRLEEDHKKERALFLTFVRDIADNYDCDEDAHKYDTRCRQCAAQKLLKKVES